MNKLATIFFILILGFTNAQIQRFSYQYRFIPDSTNKTDVKSEIMNLDITKTGSTFYSEPSYKADSATRANFQKQLNSGTGSLNVVSPTKRGLVRYTINKSYPDFQVIFENRIALDVYQVKEDRNIDWKILPEKEKIGEWNCQKAETNFGGRKWIAWFTTEVPFQDGPYKFHSLPGLIVKMEDQTKSHSFELVGVKKLNEEEYTEPFSSKKIELSRKKYLTIVKQYEADPGAAMRVAMGRSDVKIFGTNQISQKE